MADSNKITFLQWVVYVAARVIVGIIRFVPLKITFGIGEILAFFLFYIDFFGRKLMVFNILYTGVAKDKKNARRIARKSYSHMIKFFLEFLKFDQYINKENISEFVTVKASEENLKLMKNSPIILLASHFGNWEMGGIWYSRMINPLLSVMKPSPNTLITDYLISKREQFGQKICMRKDSFKFLLEALKHGESVALVVDQDARKKGVETLFFGRKTSIHMSPALLHLKTGAPIVVGSMKRLKKPLHYEVSFSDPIIFKKSSEFEADVKSIVQKYISLIEDGIKEVPEQWVWYNIRWKKAIRKEKKKNE